MSDDEHVAPVFEAINPETSITQIESMCVNCERNGTTKYAPFSFVICFVNARSFLSLALAPPSPPARRNLFI